METLIRSRNRAVRNFKWMMIGCAIGLVLLLVFKGFLGCPFPWWEIVAFGWGIVYLPWSWFFYIWQPDEGDSMLDAHRAYRELKKQEKRGR